MMRSTMYGALVFVLLAAPPAQAKPIINHCGVDGLVPHEYMVTLKVQRPLDTKEDKLSFLQGWVHQYEPEAHAVHFFTETQFAITVEAGDEAISLIAKDDTVDSVECNCFQRADVSLPLSDDSSPGVEAVPTTEATTIANDMAPQASQAPRCGGTNQDGNVA